VSAALAVLVVITGMVIGFAAHNEAAGSAGMITNASKARSGEDGVPENAENGWLTGLAGCSGKAGKPAEDGVPGDGKNGKFDGVSDDAGENGKTEKSGNPANAGGPANAGNPANAGGPGQNGASADRQSEESGIADTMKAVGPMPAFADMPSVRTDDAPAIVEAAGPPQSAPSALLVALGDSIALGIGDEEGGGFVERLRDGLEALQESPVHVTNLAVNGFRSDQLLDLLERRENARQAVAEASVIAVSIGGNDLARVIKKHALDLTMDRFDESRARFAEHLAEIVDMLTSGNESADIYLLGLFNPLSAWFSDIPELADIFDGWNRTIRETAEAHERVYYVPVDDLFAGGGPDYTADDFIHPNGAGHGLIADRTLEAIAAVTGEGDGKRDRRERDEEA
jgi:lysophospholipase L1-like esterase